MNVLRLIELLDEGIRRDRALETIYLNKRGLKELAEELRGLLAMKEANHILAERHVALRGGMMVAVPGRKPE